MEFNGTYHVDQRNHKCKNYSGECIICKNIFISKRKSSRICVNCKSKISECPICKRKLTNISLLSHNGICYHCFRKDKNYEEFYNKPRSEIKAGFAYGDKNVAKRSDIRKLISEGVKKSYDIELRKKRGICTRKNFLEGKYGYFNKPTFKNKNNELFRSNLEAQFSNFLIDNNIKYGYEVSRIELIDKSIKIIDFTINDIYVEISGFAYKSWQDDFIKKINLLRNTVNNHILILSYKEHIDRLKNEFKELKNIFVFYVEDYEKIITQIKGDQNVCGEKKI